MIRAWGFLATVAFFFCTLVGLEARESVTSYAASPAPELVPSTPFAVGEMPGAAPVSMVIRNHGAVDDRLLGASSPAATRADIHTSPLNHGVRQMLPLVEGIIIPAAGTLILEPESHHLMLVGLREDLIQGRSFPLTLRFAHAGDVTVTVRVRRRVDAAGLTPIAPVAAGDLTLSLASAPPAPESEAATPQAL